MAKKKKTVAEPLTPEVLKEALEVFAEIKDEAVPITRKMSGDELKASQREKRRADRLTEKGY